MNNTEKTHIIINCENEEFKRKLCRKRNTDRFFYLTKKGFKDYCNDSSQPVTVIGDVFLGQRKKQSIKLEGDIIGVIKVPYSYEYLRKHYDAEDNEYPLYKTKRKWRRTVGYAQLENNQFVRLVRFDASFLLLILLILLALVPCLLKSCSNFDPISIITGETITETGEKQEQAPICYYEPFEEFTELTKKSPCLSLKNVGANDKTYFVSYEIYINGEQIKDESGKAFTTGAIPPNKQVNINLWKQLKKGKYLLEVKATDYDYTILKEITDNRSNYSDREYQSLLNEAIMPVHHTLSTTLIIEK